MTKLNGRAYFAPGHPVKGQADEKDAAAAELVRLYNIRNKGRPGAVPAKVLTPQEVLRRAADPDSPLHGMFEWDDSEAAREYRLWQARTLLGAIRIEVEPNRPPVRLQNVIRVVDEERERGYVSLTSAMSSEPDRLYVLREGVGRMLSFRKRYGHMDEFAPVVAAIDALDTESMVAHALEGVA